MTPLLTRLLLFILFFLLLRWFIKQFLGNKRSDTPGNKSNLKGNMVKDPICGMYMDPRLAVTHKTDNGVFYFCSEECKNKFLSIPPGKSPEEPERNA